MADRTMKCELPNGDTLSAWYDGGKLRVLVKTDIGKAVFDRSYTNEDLTGDPMFLRQPEKEPGSEGEFIRHPAFLGPDE